MQGGFRTTRTLRNPKVLDCHRAQINRVAHASSGSFDNPLSNDFCYSIIAVTYLKGSQSVFIGRRQPLYVVLIEGQVSYETVHSHEALGP